jgi:hypothetical protein
MGRLVRGVRSSAAVLLVTLGLTAGLLTVPALPALAPARIAGYETTALLTGTLPELPVFQAVMGYRPVAAPLDGWARDRLLKPSGSCSSPLGGTVFGFTPACKAHDFGYDLLRFADRTGRPADQAARRVLDDTLASDLHAHCDATRHGFGLRLCHGMAWLYAGVARLNSWRQDYGTP